MTVRPEKARSLESFRKWITRETAIIKKLRLGITAIRFLQIQKVVRGRWPNQDDQSQCVASCVVSNIGKVANHLSAQTAPDGVIRFGDKEVTDISMVGQVQHNTNVCLHALTYRDRLTLALTYRKSRIQKEQAEYLLQSIVGRLQREES